MLLFITSAHLQNAVHAATAQELTEDPHDIIATLVRRSHPGGSGIMFVAMHLLLHGVVKVAIVVALLIGSKRVYPWAMAGLGAFVIFQIYELVTKPSVGIVALTVLDVVITWLTWREWRPGAGATQDLARNRDWVFRRSPQAASQA